LNTVLLWTYWRIKVDELLKFDEDGLKTVFYEGIENLYDIA